MTVDGITPSRLALAGALALVGTGCNGVLGLSEPLGRSRRRCGREPH